MPRRVSAGADGTKHVLHKNTAYAIELNTTVTLPEWGRDIRVMLEEPGFYGSDGFVYPDGRQTRLHLIGAHRPELGN